jgi:hypothetical protein
VEVKWVSDAQQVDQVTFRPPGPWIWLSIGAALMAAAGSAIGLADGKAIYGQETTTLADAAAAQDAVNLCLVGPLTLVLGLRARAGSVRAYLCWVGCLAFTVYNYAIYAFSIHFGPLFLVWVAVLGISFYAVVGSLATVDASAVKDRCCGRASPLAGWTLIGLATLFLMLWLSEIIPDLLAGAGSRSASDWAIPTNPVHVLDLAFFLPALLSRASADLVAEVFPDVEVRKELGEHETLLSIDKARRVLGYEPEYSWRDQAAT